MELSLSLVSMRVRVRVKCARIFQVRTHAYRNFTVHPKSTKIRTIWNVRRKRKIPEDMRRTLNVCLLNFCSHFWCKISSHAINLNISIENCVAHL